MNNLLVKADRKLKGFFLFLKSDKRKAAAAVFVLVSLGALLYPVGTWFYSGINLDLGTWLRRPVGESLQDIFKKVAAKDKESRSKLQSAATGGGGEGLGLVASGSFGSWDMAKKLPNPKSIQGIMNAGESLDRPEGVNASGEGRALDAAAGGSGSFGSGAVPAYVGKALEGPGGAAGPTIDESLLGLTSPALAQGAAHGASMAGRKHAISRGELRGFLTNDAQVDAVVSRRIVGQGGGNSAAHQLAQVKVSAQRYSQARVAEEKAMAGAAYEKHRVPLRSLTGSGEASPVHSTYPDMNPDDGMTGEMAQTAECVQAAQQVRTCSGAKTTQYLQLAQLTDQLSNLSVRIAIDCSDKCPQDCGACTRNNLIQASVCAEMASLIAKINAPCHMPQGCFMDIDNHGSGKSIVPRVYQLGDCKVQHVCGESNSFWGPVYCHGQLMIDTLTAKMAALTGGQTGGQTSGGCSEDDKAAGVCQ